VAEKDGAKEVVYTLSMVEQILYNNNETDANQAFLEDAKVAE
jgi:hypothetical protein